MFTVAFLVAFESFAVATALPVVSGELDGLRLYALSFAAPAAVAVPGMSLAAWWSDRHGFALPLFSGVSVFAAGLVVAGLSSTMAVFVAGRAVQGLGTGLVGVSLYACIAQTLDESLRPRAFVIMTSAWVLPALVGPAVAGAVTEYLGWRWIFLGVPALAVVAVALLGPAVLSSHGDRSVVLEPRRMVASVALAATVLGVSLAGQRGFARWPVVLLASVIATVVLVRPLLPVGTLTARPGIAAVIATRSLTSAAFVAAESFFPLALVRLEGFAPTAAGYVLASTAVAWFVGAWLPTRVNWLADPVARLRLGVMATVVAVVFGPLGLVVAVPVPVAVVAWTIGGLGMGLALPTLGVLLLDGSPDWEQGRNSASLQTAGSVAEAMTTAVVGAAFSALLAMGTRVPFVAVFALAATVSLLAAVASRRVVAQR